MSTCFNTCISRKFLMNDEQLLHLLKFMPQKSKKGRPVSEPTAVLQGIFYLLKTGCQWNALPKCFGSSSTIHENFQRLVQNNFFYRVWVHALEKYDRFAGLNLRQQAFDCSHSKAPLGGDNTGHSPVDRRKIGTKKSLLIDGNGLPLAIGLHAGNMHDSRAFIPTMTNQAYIRATPFKTIELDAAFDAQFIKEFLQKLDYFGRISLNSRRSKILPRKKMDFRWQVERTFSWINRFRRLLVRWEKHSRNYLGLLQFACQIIVFRNI